MKTQLAMVIDSSLCIDCRACQVACKVENQVPANHWRNWIKCQQPDTGAMESKLHPASLHFQPGNCMHCDQATCVKACPTGATYKDKADGTVKVNRQLCIGCGSCIPACPYGARYRHPQDKIVDKCDFCDKRRAAGELPACVVTCPTKARTFGNIHDPDSDVARLLKNNHSVTVINPKTDTRPNLYYLSMTAPMTWPGESKDPAPIGLWKLINPFAWGFVGLNALGVLVMLGKQLLVKDAEPVSENESRRGDFDGNEND